MTSASESHSFSVIAGDKHSEVPLTLDEPVPQALGFFDQFGLWGNLGVSLLGFTGAIFVLQPGGAGTRELSLVASVSAIVVGTLVGTLVVALSGIAGAQTGAPAMVLLRGLFGRRLSYVPTVMNVIQLLGWGIFELVTIATAAHTVQPGLARWVYIVIAGIITGLLTLRPLGAIRILRRVATPVVLVVLVYLSVELLSHHLPAFTRGTWSGYWAATDTVVAVAVSFAPLAADYTRHSRSAQTAFFGAFIGYSVTQVLCYLIGLIALVTVAKNPSDIYGAFIAVPLGSLCFALLATRELDQSFADVYSTVVSVQNLRPLWDRRVLAVVISLLATILALLINIADYENFLVLLGSVFVPMSAVFIIDFFVLARGNWSLSGNSRRSTMLIPWACGFVVYQFINPGYISWWVTMWSRIASLVHFHDQPWMSASLISFLVAAVATLLTGAITQLLIRHRPVRRSRGVNGAEDAVMPRSHD